MPNECKNGNHHFCRSKGECLKCGLKVNEMVMPEPLEPYAEYPTGINTCVHGTHKSLPCEKCSSHLTQNQMNVPGYESLGRILQTAYDQSAKGKGKKRHANNKPFEKQPIMAIGGMVGVGGHTYQVCKKAQEATSMVAREEYDAAIAELRGVIVYAAAAILLIEGME